MNIALVASYAPSVLNFRKELLQALLKDHKVVVIVPPHASETLQKIKALGAKVEILFLKPQSRNPLYDLRTLLQLLIIFKKNNIELVLSYTIKPVIFASLAARYMRLAKTYSMITGLGYTLSEPLSLKRKYIHHLSIFLYKMALKRNTRIFFQNPDDCLFFTKKNILTPEKTFVVNGSGVNLTHYNLSPPIQNPIRFLLIARLLKDKGLLEYIAAATFLKQHYPMVECHLVGYIDDNPAAISLALLNEWINNGVIIFHGELADIRPIMQQTSVYVLPSYREGTPRSVLEAMSMGRPIITTYAPGCRETVIPGFNGYWVPIKNSLALISAMKIFIHHPAYIATMGKASRLLAEKKYNVHAVNHAILEQMDLA